MKFSDVTDALDQVNTVTNTIAGNVDLVGSNQAAELELIQALKDQIAAGTPVTAEQIDALAVTAQARVAALQTVSDTLAAIAASATNPIPPVPPVELPPTPTTA